jgi:hypothetical protein
MARTFSEGKVLAFLVLRQYSMLILSLFAHYNGTLKYRSAALAAWGTLIGLLLSLVQPSQATIALEASPSWQSAGSFDASALATGDIDRNRLPDLVVGHRGHETEIYSNLSGRFADTVSFGTGTIDDTTAIIVADINGDGLPDLLHGNKSQLTLYYPHDGVRLRPVPAWSTMTARRTTSIAVADIDRDGDLDLLLGNAFQRNELYANDGHGELGSAPVWRSADATDTQDVAWADVDGDSYPDLLVANRDSLQVFHNAGGVLETVAAWQVTLSATVHAIAAGDVNGDGLPDLAVATTSENLLFCNRAGEFETTPCWVSTDTVETNDVAWGDPDADGDLDLAAANKGPNAVYENHAGILSPTPGWLSADSRNTKAVLWLDNGDGDPDLAAANSGAPSVVYFNSQDVNTPPVAHAGKDLVLFLDNDGVAQTLLDGTGSFDADEDDVLSFQWFALPTNPQPEVLDDPHSPTPQLVTTTTGRYRFQLVVSDGIVSSPPALVTVLVNSPGNTAPVVFAGDNLTAEINQDVVLAQATAGDFNNDALTFQWQEDPRNPQLGLLGDEQAVSLNPILTPLIPGGYIFTLTASDGTVSSTPSQVTVTVDDPLLNATPIADAGEDLMAEVGNEVSLIGLESVDPDGDILSYHWFEDANNPFAFGQLSDIDTPVALFKPTLPGTYVFYLVVNDGLVDSAPDAVTVRVNATGNSVPVAAIKTRTGQIQPRTSLTLDGSESSDADGDDLTFQWFEDPTNPSLGRISNPHIPKPLFQAEVEGLYRLFLLVNDGIVDSSPATLTVRVSTELPPPGDGSSDGDGNFCFITAITQGTIWQSWLQPLRLLRDRFLLPHHWGRRIVVLYYHSGPRLYRLVAEHQWLRGILQVLLLPVIAASWLVTHLSTLSITLLGIPLATRLAHRRSAGKDP